MGPPVQRHTLKFYISHLAFWTCVYLPFCRQCGENMHFKYSIHVSSRSYNIREHTYIICVLYINTYIYLRKWKLGKYITLPLIIDCILPLFPQHCPAHYSLMHELGKLVFFFLTTVSVFKFLNLYISFLKLSWIANVSFAKLLCDLFSTLLAAKLWPLSHVWANYTLGQIHLPDMVILFQSYRKYKWLTNQKYI